MNRPEGNLAGRININTATKEVIRAAIPPYTDDPSDPDFLIWDPEVLADAIVSNRPFQKISDLLGVSGFDQFIGDNKPNLPATADSQIDDDFEERDWILSRVANIFTVRSDVFTAYILVRLGEDGPQRRMIAILDRSNVYSRADKPKVVALHPVPDPR